MIGFKDDVFERFAHLLRNHQVIPMERAVQELGEVAEAAAAGFAHA